MKTKYFMYMMCVVVLVFALGIQVRSSIAAENEIILGYSGPLSGGAAKFGLNIQWGLELAADDINAMGGADVGGKKYKVRVISPS